MVNNDCSYLYLWWNFQSTWKSFHIYETVYESEVEFTSSHMRNINVFEIRIFFCRLSHIPTNAALNYHLRRRKKNPVELSSAFSSSAVNPLDLECGGQAQCVNRRTFLSETLFLYFLPKCWNMSKTNYRNYWADML